MADILVAEDVEAVRQMLRTALEAEGHIVETVEDGCAALTAFKRKCPDLVMLDLMMPRKGGFEVCEEIRRSNKTMPVIILSARDGEEDKLLGFGLGADDYVVKPFSVGELRARVNARLRHIRALGGLRKKRFSFGTGVVDEARFAYIDQADHAVRLSPRELMLLRLFVEHRGEVLTRDLLMSRLWGVDYYGNTRTVDQHIARLRQKVWPAGRRIETVPRLGYVYQ